jgi:hypothetical protein
MRGMGLFFGVVRRNANYLLEDPRPIARLGDDQHTGDAGRDGYTLLSRADPAAQGNPPSVSGTLGRAHQGPDQSFEA